MKTNFFLFKFRFDWWTIILIIGLSSGRFCAQNVQFISQNENLYQLKTRLDTYFDNLHTTISDDEFYAEGNDYTKYQAFLSFWEPRLFPDGDFERYFSGLANFYNNKTSFKQMQQNVIWQEIGPTSKPTACNSNNFGDANGAGCNARGLGPMEFISFYKGNPQYMISGSTMGGIFYSTNGGTSWQATGTDTELPRSGCVAATFSPNDYKTWFAAGTANDANESGAIGYAGGIFRTTDEGVRWKKIADYQNFQTGSYNWYDYTRIYKLLAPDPSNQGTLYAATSCGLFVSFDANSLNPSWQAVESGTISGTSSQLIGVYDIETKPNDPATLYC